MSRSIRSPVWSCARGRQVSLLTLAFFVPLATGCVSNEYLIPKPELMRQAELPAAARGQRVRVVQDLGDRRGYPVPPNLPPAPTPPPTSEPPSPPAPTSYPYPIGESEETASVEGDLAKDGDTDGDANVQINIGNGDLSGSGRAVHRMPAQSRIPVPAHSSGGWHAAGRSVPSGGHLGGGHIGGGHIGGGGGGHIGVGGGGGGGGGNGGDALVVLAVVAIVVGVVVGVALVTGEGMRFDGYVQMAPEQPIHIKDCFGQKRELPLATLTLDDVDETVEAKVMDDEGFGIERLDRVPLDRTGGTFKLDSGETTFGLGPSSFYGPTATIQLGYFFTRKLGLLMNVALGGSSTDDGTIVTRHTFSLELQSLPLAKGRWHAGGYADAGFALAGNTGRAISNGPAGGGGALVELDLTSRMALTLRAGANLARLDDGWSPAGSLAIGIAVY